MKNYSAVQPELVTVTNKYLAAWLLTHGQIVQGTGKMGHLVTFHFRATPEYRSLETDFQRNGAVRVQDFLNSLNRVTDLIKLENPRRV